MSEFQEFPVAIGATRESAEIITLPEIQSRETATPGAIMSLRASAKMTTRPAKPSRESGERAIAPARGSAIVTPPSQPSPKGGRQATNATRKSSILATPAATIPDDATVLTRESAEVAALVIGADATRNTSERTCRPAHPHSSPARERAANGSTRESAKPETPPDTWVPTWAPNSPLCEDIKALVRTRQQWLSAKNRLLLHAKALCRSVCGGDKKEGAALYARIWKGEETALAPIIAPFVADIRQWEARIDPVEGEILRLFAQTPIAGAVAATKGLGPMSIATLIGMSADFSTIPKVSQLWTRFGLHVSINGDARGPLLEPGRVSRFPRRAAAFVVGAGLLKAGNTRFRELYDREKAKALGKGWTKARAHNHAMRYGTKDALRALWKAWRQETEQ